MNILLQCKDYNGVTLSGNSGRVSEYRLDAKHIPNLIGSRVTFHEGFRTDAYLTGKITKIWTNRTNNRKIIDFDVVADANVMFPGQGNRALRLI